MNMQRMSGVHRGIEEGELKENQCQDGPLKQAAKLIHDLDSARRVIPSIR